MPVKIGHASIDENGKAHGGASGDQNGREVCIRDWWNGGWDLVLRPKDPNVASKMAKACMTLCNSNLVGYDQWQRNTLWDELEKVGWDASQLKNKCETDCSAFMAACARCAGVEVLRVQLSGGGFNAPITSTMKDAFVLTGKFECLTGRDYTTSSDKLKIGDILVRKSGHTVMVLSDGEKSVGQNSNGVDVAKSYNKSLAGTYSCTAFALNIRSGAGIEKPLLGNLKKNEKVECYGYYTLVGNTKWLLIKKPAGWTGYVSEKYLRKEV